MAAATSAIDTPSRPGNAIGIPAAASTTIYAGTLVAVNTSGNAVPASDTASLKVVGVARETVDNSAGAAGDKTVVAERGVFRLNNSGADAVDADDLLKVCYVSDDNTVRESTGTNSIKAGLVLEVDSDGVWVDVGLAPAI